MHRKTIPIAVVTSIVITTAIAKPAPAFLDTLRSLVSEYLPVLESALGGYLETFIGDYGGIVSGIITDTADSVLNGQKVRLENILGRALPQVSEQVYNDTGIPPGVVINGGQGVFQRDKDRVIAAGRLLLEDRLRRNRRGGNQPIYGPVVTGGGAQTPQWPPYDPNTPFPSPTGGNEHPGGVSTPGGGGSTPGGGGRGSNGVPDLPGIPQPRTVAKSGPIGTSGCLYTTTCVGSLPEAYQQIFENATGVLGHVDPVQVRGKIFEQAAQGKTADAFAGNAYASAHFVANEVTREMSRASTQAYLSVAAQEKRQENKDAIAELMKAKRKITQSGAASTASQEVLKSNLSILSMIPELQSAQIELTQQGLDDSQYMKLNLANLSETADWQRRQRDTELSAQTYNSLYNTFGAALPIPSDDTPLLQR